LSVSAVVVAALGLGWVAVAGEVVLILGLLAVERHTTPLIDRWGRGAHGEEHVGEILDGLRDDGWFAIHDVSTGRGNIDHILIGPAGIFTIETKSHPGRINADRIDSRMLKQAYAEAKIAERITGRRLQRHLELPASEPLKEPTEGLPMRRRYPRPADLARVSVDPLRGDLRRC
jgi:Nuclease-related domain